MQLHKPKHSFLDSLDISAVGLYFSKLSAIRFTFLDFKDLIHRYNTGDKIVNQTFQFVNHSKAKTFLAFFGPLLF